MMGESQMIGIIGVGNMGGALVKGLIESGVYDPGHLLACDKREEAIKSISSQFGLQYCSSNADLISKCSTVVFSVKPQNMREVLEEVKGGIRDDHLLISIAAGIPFKTIHAFIDREIPIIRVMPNTPALVQKGVSALAAGHMVTPEHMAIARKIFGAVGETVEVEETMMDAVTALSGSGPGYVFRIMECMVDAGVDAGLERDVSVGLIVQTFLGAASLAKESGNSLSSLREMVTSPGGTTAAGLVTFDNMGLENIIKSAVRNALKRSIELGKDH